MPSLTTIIVTFNSADRIAACLAALLPQLPPASQVILVDNASSDSTLEQVRADSRVCVFANSVNQGFAKAVNRGFEAATGDLVLLLNPDCELTCGVINRAVECMGSNPDVWILGPRIILPDGREDLAAHRAFKTPATYFYKMFGLSRMFPKSPRFGRYYMTDAALDALTDVGSVVGAFMMTRRSVVTSIGPLDERFFMYCEDEDWCFRVKQAGGRVVYHPDLIVVHHKGSSARLAKLKTTYEWHRSVYLFHRKNIAPRYSIPVNGAIYTGICVGFVAKMIAAITSRRR